MKDFNNKLILYAIYGDLKGIRKALQQGADINTPNLGTTPLYEAVSTGNMSVIDELLNHLAIETNKHSGTTGYAALHAAVLYSFYCDDSDQALLLEKLLRDNRFDIRIPSRAPLTIGFTPLHLAAYLGYNKAIELLIRAGAMPTDMTANNLSVYDVAGKNHQSSQSHAQLAIFMDKIVNRTILSLQTDNAQNQQYYNKMQIGA